MFAESPSEIHNKLNGLKMEAKLLEAKRELYSLLLNKKKLTDNEAEIMFYLSKDKQIQELLTNKMKKNDNN